MKSLIIAATLLASTAAFAADKPKEYSDAFCTGFNAAVAMEAQRASNWSTFATLSIGTVKPDKLQEVARAVTLTIKSFDIYVRLTPLVGKVDVGGSNFVDCTPPTAPTPPAPTAPAPTPAPQESTPAAK